MASVPDIDLDLMRAFLTVLESGGFTHASKLLHVTQSGITLKIKRLEQQLNCRLFKRTTKPLELSHEGEIVLGYARRLLDLNQEMAERVTKPKKEIPLRLGVVDHFGPEMLPLWLSRFKANFPNAKIVSDIGLTHELLKDLEDDKFDLVIASAGYTSMAEYKFAPTIQETHFQRETMLWVRAKNSKIDPKQDPLPLVMFGPKCRFRPITLETLNRAGRAYEIVFVGGSLNSVQTGVVADLGLSVLSPLSLARGLEVLEKDSGLPNLPTADLAIYYRKRASHPLVSRLATFLVESVAALEASRLPLNGPLQKKSGTASRQKTEVRR
jgi:DNA-binding transcriptional LysR family regulator